MILKSCKLIFIYFLVEDAFSFVPKIILEKYRILLISGKSTKWTITLTITSLSLSLSTAHPFENLSIYIIRTYIYICAMFHLKSLLSFPLRERASFSVIFVALSAFLLYYTRSIASERKGDDDEFWMKNKFKRASHFFCFFFQLWFGHYSTLSGGLRLRKGNFSFRGRSFRFFFFGEIYYSI